MRVAVLTAAAGVAEAEGSPGLKRANGSKRPGHHGGEGRHRHGRAARSRTRRAGSLTARLPSA